jgi:predicted nucleic acid-binding Zn ribbon protein
MTVTKIVQHKHCIFCGRAITVEDDFCAEECKTLYDEKIAKRKQTLYLWMGAGLILAVFVMIGG